MSTYRSAFFNEFSARGHMHQSTNAEGLDALMARGCVPAYIGFDCTAPSMHIGNLTQIMRLRVLQRNGHKPIVVIGGGTTKIGDPSGKDETRQLLTEETIERHKQRFGEIFRRFLTFGDGPTDAIMVDNAEWLDRLPYIPFLRDIGRHFSVNRMITMDSVKLRLEREQPLSFLEFNYMILQAYDFVELYRRFGCRLQMGGSDQWGNIVSGIDLARRTDNAELFGLTSPLITTSSGAKMGKTAAGAVWLSDDMLSAYDYWQYWRNVEDADVGRFMRIFTDLPLDEIARLEALQGAERNEAKKILANEATALCHGRAAAEKAAETARQTFEGAGVSADLPSIEVPASELSAGIGILAAFTRAGLTTSNGDARRQISGGGLRLNDEAVSDDKLVVGNAHLRDGAIKLSLGKKKHMLIKPV
jgi:tyrosyl-tRNA synthetase